MTDARGPLAGIVVIEVATYLSAPFATMMLSDLGADVIKVEPPSGDPLRRLGRATDGQSALFVNSNRGKRSVCLDLKDPGDRDRLTVLLKSADVFVTNARAGALDRLNLSDADLVACNDRLVRVFVSGYGPDGPLAEAPTFDGIVQARSALAATQGDEDGPALANTYVVDKMSGVMVGQAILAALVARERQGVADRVDVAMLDANAYANFPDVMWNRTFVDRQPADWRNRQAAATRPIAASDGWLVIAPVSSGQMKRAFDVVDRPSVGASILASSDPVEIARRFHYELELVTSQDTVAHWVRVFTEYDVPVAPCLDVDQHLVDSQVVHNQLYSVDDWSPVGRTRHVRYPALFSSWSPLRARRGPPTLGQDSSELLSDP